MCTVLVWWQYVHFCWLGSQRKLLSKDGPWQGLTSTSFGCWMREGQEADPCPEPGVCLLPSVLDRTSGFLVKRAGWSSLQWNLEANSKWISMDRQKAAFQTHCLALVFFTHSPLHARRLLSQRSAQELSATFYGLHMDPNIFETQRDSLTTSRCLKMLWVDSTSSVIWF